MLLSYIGGPIAMIRRFRKLAITLIALSCSLLNGAAAKVMGAVVDSQGAAIGKAQIVIRADSSGKRARVKDRDLILEQIRKATSLLTFRPGSTTFA